MREIRLTIKCEKTKDHSKLLKFPVIGGEEMLPRQAIDLVGKIVSGTSSHFVHKPGSMSPIGFCCICQGKLTYDVEERIKPEKKGSKYDAQS